MSRQLEARECARCQVESLDLEDFLWFDVDAREWRTGPVCRDRQACAERIRKTRAVTALSQAAS